MKFIHVCIISMMLFFSGCVHSINQQGLTISIPASKITESLASGFPVQQNFQYGTLTLKDPKAMLQAGSDKVTAGTSIDLSSPLIPTQSGSLYVSGKPYFDAQSGAIYLHNPDIETLDFNGYKLASMIQGPLKEAIMPLINEVFRTNPIYRLDQNSLQNHFVNDIRVNNGELLVTFGL